jgi:hypothetical protein
MKPLRKALSLLLLLVMAGCATLPSGPTVQVMPQPGKPFDLFRSEDADCRQWAAGRIGMTREETANNGAVTGAAVGTAIGAGVGALMGAASGHAGAGAAIGAGTGLLFGTAIGADQDRVYGWKAQQLYDNAYAQCMYSHGNRIVEPVRMYGRRRVYVRREPVYYYAAPPVPPSYQPPLPDQPPPPLPSAVPPPPPM